MRRVVSRESKSCSIGNQFKDGTRNQQSVGSCSLFSGLATIESAYFREYNKKINLSEMWMAREAVREGLRSEVYKGEIYIGQTTYDQLKTIRKSGICLEKDYPYTWFGSTYINNFEDDDGTKSSYIFWTRKASSAELEASRKSRLKYFDKAFGSSNDSKLRACRARANTLKSSFGNFLSPCILNPHFNDIAYFIKRGIALDSGMDTWHITRNRKNTDSSHAVCITSCKLKENFSYELGFRNSWGRTDSSNAPYQSRSPETGKIERAAYEICPVLGPTDLNTLCLENSPTSPKIIKHFCKVLRSTPDQLKEDMYQAKSLSDLDQFDSNRVKKLYKK